MTFWNRLLEKGRPFASVVLMFTAIFVGGLGFAALASLKKPPVVREEVPVVFNVEVYEAQPLTLREMISGFGTARPDREVVVSAQVSGTIMRTSDQLEIGQAVRGLQLLFTTSWPILPVTGDLLVEIDPRTFQQRLLQAETRLEELDADLARVNLEVQNIDRLVKQAQDDYDIYKLEYDRAVKSFESRAISPSQFTQTRLQFRTYEQTLITRKQEQALLPKRKEAMEKRIEATKSDLELARLDLYRTEVHPPFDGVVSDVMAEQGQYVRTGDPLFRLTDVNTVEIPVPLTLSDYGRLRERLEAGERPRVLLAESETEPHRWEGVLERIAPKADEATRTIEVYVTVDNQSQKTPLLPGTFVHALIEGPLHTDAMIIPRDAITVGHVFLSEKGKTVKQPIEPLRTFQELAIVDAEAISSGDRLVLTNLDRLADGVSVTEVKTHTASEALAEQRTELLCVVGGE